MLQVTSNLDSKSWIGLIISIIAGAISSLASLALIHITSKIIAEDDGYAPLGTFVILIIVLLIATSLSRFSAYYSAQRILFALRMWLATSIVASGYSKVASIGTARLMTVFNDDIQKVQNAFYVLPSAIVHVLIIVASLSYIIYNSITVFIIVVVFAIIFLPIHILIYRSANLGLLKARKIQDSMSTDFKSMLDGIKELITHERKRNWFFSKLYSVNVRHYCSVSLVICRKFAIAEGLGAALFFVLVGLLIFSSLGAIPGLTVTRQQLTSTALLVLFMAGPITGLMLAVPVLMRAGTAIEHIRGLALHPKTGEAVEPLPQDKRSEVLTNLSLVGIEYQHPHKLPTDEGFSLGPIDLTFSPGEITFIVGDNGSGKSSLAKLISGLLAPTSGQILLNGSVVSESKRERMQSMCTILLPPFYVFESLFGFENDHGRKITELLCEYNLTDKVGIHEGQFTNRDLSQGQGRRLALLIAQLEDRPIYIVDEWAAEQDPDFKHFFYTEVLPSWKKDGRCVVAISHDHDYLNVADRIITLSKGVIT